MTTTPNTIAIDAWIDDHRPRPAPSGDGGFDFGDGSTLLDWTKPDDMAFLDAADPNCVWTVVDGDGPAAIIAGRHMVNRIGYIVTEVPWTNDDMEVVTDDADEDTGADAD